MISKPTDELNKILENTKPGQIEGYLKDNRACLADKKKGFYYYFKEIVEKKGIKLKDVYIDAGVSESYGSQIVRQEKPRKDRDLILRLCIAGHFTWDEINRSLKLYGMRELYAKDPRDAVVIVAVNNRIYDLYQIDEMLTNQGLDGLFHDNND